MVSEPRFFVKATALYNEIMQVLFLGTGPAIGIPRKGHDDPTCKDARHGGKSRRRRSAALIRDKSTILLIDAGPDIEVQLEEHHPKTLDALLITHGHRDAVGGLKELNRWVKKHLDHALPVLTDAVTEKRLKSRFGNLPCLQFVTFKSFDDCVIHGLHVMPVPVIHSKDIPTWGFVIGGKLFYASDFGDLPAKTAKAVGGVPNMILDGTFWFERKVLPTHLTIDEAIDWGISLDAERIILTQIGHTYPPHDEAVKKLQRYLKDRDIKNPSVELGFDGMRVKF